MAGRGTDIILGGNSDYMARLKLREVLLGRLAGPRTPQAAGPPTAQRFSRRLADASASTLPCSSENLYPCNLPTSLIKPFVSCPVIC